MEWKSTCTLSVFGCFAFSSLVFLLPQVKPMSYVTRNLSGRGVQDQRLSNIVSPKSDSFITLLSPEEQEKRLKKLCNELHHAINQEKFEEIILLLKKDPKVAYTLNREFETALERAIKKGSPEAIACLFEHAPYESLAEYFDAMPRIIPQLPKSITFITRLEKNNVTIHSYAEQNNFKRALQVLIDSNTNASPFPRRLIVSNAKEMNELIKLIEDMPTTQAKPSLLKKSTRKAEKILLKNPEFGRAWNEDFKTPLQVAYEVLNTYLIALILELTPNAPFGEMRYLKELKDVKGKTALDHAQQQGWLTAQKVLEELSDTHAR
jgi:ankyrin repeat protein